jgi:hypothetical protein
MLRLTAALLLSLSIACGGVEVSTPGGCAPGQTQPCECAPGQHGAATCAADGSSYSACVCAPPDVAGLEQDARLDAGVQPDIADRIPETWTPDPDARDAREPGPETAQDVPTPQDTPPQDTPEAEPSEVLEAEDAPAEDACAPDCEGKACGSDGCGGSCGACADGQVCEAHACAPGCADGCDGAGLTRCAEGGGVQTCAPGEDGCLSWGAPQPCAAGQHCQDGGCACDPPLASACCEGQVCWIDGCGAVVAQSPCPGPCADGACVVATTNLPSPAPHPVGLAWTGEALWIQGELGALRRWHPDTDASEPACDLPGRGLAFDGARLWTRTSGDAPHDLTHVGAPLALSAGAGAPCVVMGTLPGQTAVLGLAVGDGSLWILESTPDGAVRIAQIDPVTGQVLQAADVATTLPAQADLGFFKDGAGFWVAGGDQVMLLDAATQVYWQHTIPDAVELTAVAMHQGTLWVADRTTGLIHRLDLQAWCSPHCQSKVCGPDGCGGSCGACGAEESCIHGLCLPACGDGTCQPHEGPCACPEDCPQVAGSCDPCECGGAGADQQCYCDVGCLIAQDCCPDVCEVCGLCAQCGDGACEYPETDESCDADCCTPDCTDKDCGDNGCGDLCGICYDDTVCVDFDCVGE